MVLYFLGYFPRGNEFRWIFHLGSSQNNILMAKATWSSVLLQYASYHRENPFLFYLNKKDNRKLLGFYLIQHQLTELQTTKTVKKKNSSIAFYYQNMQILYVLFGSTSEDFIMLSYHQESPLHVILGATNQLLKLGVVSNKVPQRYNVSPYNKVQ